LKSRYNKAEGIILKAVKFGEGHKILTTYTKELGKIEITAFGSQKPKSKLANKTQLFNYVKFLIYHNRSKENVPFTAKDIEVLKYFDKIKNDYSKYIAANCIVEPIIKLIDREQQDITIFNLVLKTLYTLEIIEKEKIVFLIFMYLIKLLSSLGYRFNFDFCSICNVKLNKDIFIDSYKGFPLCIRCKTNNSLRLEEGTIKFMNWAQDEEIYKAIKVTMNENTLVNIKIALTKIYEFIFDIKLDGWKHFDSFINEINTG